MSATECGAYVQKELGDRKSASIDFVRQLLPLPKMFCEVIMSEYVHSGSGDARGGGSTHKTNNDADQRKQVSIESSVLHCSSYMLCHYSLSCPFMLLDTLHALQRVYVIHLKKCYCGNI